MRVIVGDINVEGHLRDMVNLLTGSTWREVWNWLNLQVYTFKILGFSATVSDAVLWHTCQQEQLVLITANRNQKGTDSLEATIRAHNTLTSLPVLTVADPQHLLDSKEYTERVVVRLLEILLDIDRYRGSGRLYLP